MAMVHQRNQDIFGCLTDKEQATLSGLFDRLIAHARPGAAAGNRSDVATDAPQSVPSSIQPR
jgi:hypothetical protein